MTTENKSFSFIESGLVLNTNSVEDLQDNPVNPQHFAIHGDAYEFVLDYLDEFGSFANSKVIIDKFPDLESDAIGADLVYCVKEFKKQVLTRNAIDTIRGQQNLMRDDPTKAIENIQSGLDGLSLQFDEGLEIYDDGGLGRLNQYLNRKEQRSNSRMKIIGIPTPLRTLNRTGVGMQAGQVFSLFARPTVGKTWFCVKMAAICVNLGHKTLFVTAEMPANQIALRIDVVLGNMLGYNFSHDAMRRGEGLDEKEYEKFLTEIENKNMLVCDHIEQSAISLPGITSLVRKYRPKVLIIDGIQLLSSGSRNNSSWEKMGDLFYGVKNLCMTHDLVGVISTQANRNASDLFRSPRANEVALGDALLQASDVAMSMSLVENEDNKRQIQLQKYRDGIPPVNAVTMDWDVDIGLISEVKE